MRNRESASIQKNKKSKLIILAVVAAVLVTAAAAAAFFYQKCGWFVIRNADSGEIYARYFVRDGDWFSIGFIHSVNKSPLTDYYEFHDHSIYVEKTVYYSFGAGVQTELEEGQHLEYGDDGSMIVSGFHKEIPDLIYIVGTVSDHIMVINGGEDISLSELCGAREKVRFSYDTLF